MKLAKNNFLYKFVCVYTIMVTPWDLIYFTLGFFVNFNWDVFILFVLYTLVLGFKMSHQSSTIEVPVAYDFVSKPLESVLVALKAYNSVWKWYVGSFNKF